MKTSQVAALLLTAGSVVSAQTIIHQAVSPDAVTRVETALNHISLIEMPEPIVRAAIGSDDFKIEWHGNTVALKPNKQGQPTNLFVWTEHTQSSYEILPPGDVKTAAFVIDQTESKPPAPKMDIEKSSETEVRQATGLMVAQIMLESFPVNSRGVKNENNHVNVRITSVVHGSDELYVRYSLVNLGRHPYRVDDPTVTHITPAAGTVSVAGLNRTQINQHKLAGYGRGETAGVTVRDSRVSDRDLIPGHTTEGVICLKKADTQPRVYHFVFADDEGHPVGAVAIL